MSCVRFAFLLPNNPYRPWSRASLQDWSDSLYRRPYYEHKVKEFKTGVVEAPRDCTVLARVLCSRGMRRIQSPKFLKQS